MSAPLPGWIVWLLSRRLSDAWREVVLGDLAEEFRGARRRRAGGRPPLAVVAGGALPGVAATESNAGGPAVAARGETPDAADARRRCPLCRPRPRAGAVVHARRGGGARPRHRRHDRDLQHRQHRAAAAAAVRRRRSAGAAVPRAAAGHLPRHPALRAVAGQLLRLAAGGARPSRAWRCTAAARSR